MYYNDINPYACRVLRSHIAEGSLPPGFVDSRDIRMIKTDEIQHYGRWAFFAGVAGFELGFRWSGMPDDFPICTGGFPCKDISVSSHGSHQGLTGKHSGLFYPFKELVLRLMPEWLVIENVTQASNPNIANVILSTFRDWHLREAKLPAYRFGAYTRRVRTFFIGHLGTRVSEQVFDFSFLPAQAFQTGGAEDVLPMCLPWAGGLSLERLGATVLENPQTYPFRVREGNGVSRRMDADRIRWDLIGNSVSPIVAAWIGYRILSQ